MIYTKYMNKTIHGKWNLMEKKKTCIGNGKECNEIPMEV